MLACPLLCHWPADNFLPGSRMFTKDCNVRVTFPDKVVTTGCWLHHSWFQIGLGSFIVGAVGKKLLECLRQAQVPCLQPGWRRLLHWQGALLLSSHLNANSFQIDKRSKSANKRGTAFLVQYNGTWSNGKWDGAGVFCFCFSLSNMFHLFFRSLFWYIMCDGV